MSAMALPRKGEDELTKNMSNKPVPDEMYREDQCSLFNPDRKKKYERDFLINLRNTTEAKKKPEIHADVMNVVLKVVSNRERELSPCYTDNSVEKVKLLLKKPMKALRTDMRQMRFLVRNGYLKRERFLRGFREIVVLADNLAVHGPKVWLQLAEILVPMLSTEALSFADLKAAAIGLDKLVVEILCLLVKEKGPGWIRQRWDEAGMSWTDFAPADNIDQIVKDNELEFTVGGGELQGAPAREASAVDKPSYSDAYAQMCKVLWNIGVVDGCKEGQPDNVRKLLLRCYLPEFEERSQVDLKHTESLKEAGQCADMSDLRNISLDQSANWA